MIFGSSKSVIVAPDSNPSSGLGHITRCLSLINRLNSEDTVYLILDPSFDYLCNKSPFTNTIPSPHMLPHSIYEESIMLIIDSYDIEFSSSISHFFSTRAMNALNILSLCDTFDQAKDTLMLLPSTDLLFPNIIDNQLISQLNDLCLGTSSSFYHGFPFILLDPVITNSPQFLSRQCFSNTQSTCLVSFGFSSFTYTMDLLDHFRSVISKFKSQFPSLSFYLLGPNALKIFLELDYDCLISEYHEFLDKSLLVQLYDSSTFFFGSIGYSMWERAFRLLPSFVCPIASNQVPYIDIGKNLNIHCSSVEVLSPDFCVPSYLSSLSYGTMNFRKEILDSQFQLNDRL